MAKKLRLRNIFGKDAKIKFEGSGDGVTKVAELPSEGVVGRIYYNTTDKKYYVYNETTSDFTELGGSVNPADVMPTVEQTTTSAESGGTNVVTFTFPNGETTEVSIKNGAQGNSGVASADGVIVVNNLTEGGTSVTENGVTKVKVLSAEMGKELANSTIVEKGSLGEALNKAMNNNSYFPWLLKEDTNNGTITKMMWHVGDRTFVDAVGSVISGEESGILTIIAANNGYLVLKDRSDNTNTYELTKGLNQFTFEDLNTTDGKFKSMSFKDSSNNSTVNLLTYIDFGGIELTYMWHMFAATTSLVNVDRIKYIGSQTSCAQAFATSSNTIKSVTFSECTIVNTGLANDTIISSNKVSRLDMSKVYGVVNVRDCISLSYLDIRNTNPNNASYPFTSLPNNYLYNLRSLSKLIIGNFDTSGLTANPVSFLAGSVTANAANNYTLVCVNQTPPATTIIDAEHPEKNALHILLTKAYEILVPPGTSAAYKAADVWEDYEDKISEYYDGEY